MTKEQLEQEIASMESDRERLIAQVNMVTGAIKFAKMLVDKPQTEEANDAKQE